LATAVENLSATVRLADDAPAKVNLTLRVLGRRSDGYHELESLVVFADFGDRLSFCRSSGLALAVRGPSSAVAGAGDDNLVHKAARALAERRPGLVLGAFDLDKRLPVAAGLGGGSSDAAAALRLLAEANAIAPDDPDLYAAARATGADVPVCLDPRPRIMRGIGERLSAALALPPLSGVLVNPGVALPTKAVFAGWKVAPAGAAPLDEMALASLSNPRALMDIVARQANDLEPPAIALQPSIAGVLRALRERPGCSLARMSGSGATCFGLFSTPDEAVAAEQALSAQQQTWWVKATTFGGR
jgi:4-diphosphocytidyl-2-C-methyl-D-erythritol kinase